MCDWLIDPFPEPQDPPDDNPPPDIIGISLLYSGEVPGYAGERLGRGDDGGDGENIIILGGDGENVEVSEAGLAGLRDGFLESFESIYATIQRGGAVTPPKYSILAIQPPSPPNAPHHPAAPPPPLDVLPPLQPLHSPHAILTRDRLHAL